MKFELEPHHRNVPDEELIADVKRVAAALGKSSVTIDEYNRRVAIFRETRNGSVRFRERKIGDEFACGGPRSSCVRRDAPLRFAPRLPQ